MWNIAEPGVTESVNCYKKQFLFVFQWDDWSQACGTSWRGGFSLILCVIRRQFSYKTSSRAVQ